jgi:cytoskeletal protein RodZ
MDDINGRLRSAALDHQRQNNDNERQMASLRMDIDRANKEKVELQRYLTELGIWANTSTTLSTVTTTTNNNNNGTNSGSTTPLSPLRTITPTIGGSGQSGRERPTTPSGPGASPATPSTAAATATPSTPSTPSHTKNNMSISVQPLDNSVIGIVLRRRIESAEAALRFAQVTLTHLYPILYPMLYVI